MLIINNILHTTMIQHKNQIQELSEGNIKLQPPPRHKKEKTQKYKVLYKNNQITIDHCTKNTKQHYLHSVKIDTPFR